MPSTRHRHRSAPPVQPRAGAVRSDRRPGQAQAVPRLLPPVQGRSDARGLPDHRLRPALSGLRRGLPRARPRGARRVRAHGARRQLEGLRAAAELRRLRRRRRRANSPTRSRRPRREIDAEGERLVYLSVPPGAMEAMVRMLGETGIAENASLVVEKPFGHDVESARALNAALHEVLAGGVDLPDRPLPRQGGGAEHPRAALRQRHLRAGVEPRPRRLRADRRPGEARHPGPRRASTRRPGRSATWSSPISCRSSGSSRSSRRRGSMPSRCTSSARKVFQAIRPLDPKRVVFGQYEGYRDERGRGRRLRGRDVRRARGVGRHLALVGDPVLPAHRQGDGRGPADGDDRLHRGAAADLPRRDPDAAPRPSELVFELSDDPQVRIEVQAKIPGPTHLARPGGAQARRRRGVRRSRRPGGLRAAAARRDAARAAAVHALGADRAAVGGRRSPCSSTARPPEPYAQGSWGPEDALALPGDHGWRLQAERR